MSLGRRGENEELLPRLQKDYRTDIDWLRAIAVIAVIGFHFEIPGFRGGFVGVDVFFVISGYLIGGIVLADLASGTFSFAEFWRHRARRILPALYVMVAATIAPALLILLQHERLAFLRSLASVALFSSNLFFWSHSGYFDRTAVDAPLLHTWSLAVEEQFYIAFPVVAWLLFRLGSATGRRTVVALGFAAIAAVSLVVSEQLIASGNAAAAFYLPHTRAWEFLLGVALVILPSPWLAARWLPPAGKILGTILIVIAVNSYRSGMLFPGVTALLPCFGAAVFIASGPPAGPQNQLLAGAQLIGRISYSLYLWHWPLFTLARLHSVAQMPTPAQRAGLLVVLLAVSWLSYRTIEQPCRRWQGSASRVFAAAAIGAAALCGVSALSLVGSGALYKDDVRFAKLRSFEHYDEWPYGAGKCFTGGWTDHNRPDCFVRHSKTAILLWGDSMAAHFLPGLTSALQGEDVDLLEAAGPECFPTTSMHRQPDWCNLLGRRVMSFVEDNHPTLVVISAYWTHYLRILGYDGIVADLRETARRVSARGTRVVVFGPGIQFRSDLPNILIRAGMRKTDVDPSEIVLPGLFNLDRRMRASLAGSDATYLSPLLAACPDEKCPLMAAPDVPMTRDFAHLTVEGSRLVMQALWPRLNEQLSEPRGSGG